MKEKNEADTSTVILRFLMGIDQEKCLQHLQLAYGEEVLSHTTVFRWLIVFHSGWNLLLDEEHTGSHSQL